MKNRFCGNCGTQLEEDSKFCGSCGTQLEESPEFCGSCEIELEENSKFCSGCGAVVKQTSHESPTQQYQQPMQPDMPKKLNKLPVIAGAIALFAVIVAVTIWLLNSTTGNIEAYNSIMDDIRELTDFHVSETFTGVSLDSEAAYYGRELRSIRDTYTSGTLNESRRIFNDNFVESDLEPFISQRVYIDGTEYRVSVPYPSSPDVLIYEQRTSILEWDLSIERHIQEVTFSESILDRFLTRRDDLLQVSVTGYDVVYFLQAQYEEHDGMYEYGLLLYMLRDADMTDAYITISLERVEDGFRIINNSYFPGIHRYEMITYISPWDPEPIVPFLREDVDANPVDREPESQLSDERRVELDSPDFIEAYNSIIGDIRELTDFHVSETLIGVNLDSENEFYGNEYRMTTDTYTSGTLNESRRISTSYFEEDDGEPFVSQSVYIDGIEYRVSAPYLSLPDVLIYEQSRTRRMEEYDLSIEQHIQDVTFSEDILERFLTRRGDLLQISVTGYDIIDFYQMQYEELGGMINVFFHRIRDVDMTDAYITIFFERIDDGFRITNNSYTPGMSRSEVIKYITPWEPEPIVPFLREDFDSDLVDRELESQLWDERWSELDIPDFDREQWERAGDWSDFTGFNFVREHLSDDLEIIWLMNHPPFVDFASLYLRDNELDLIGFSDTSIDFSSIDSMNADFRTISHLRYADEAILEMMGAINERRYIDLNGFYLVRACEERDIAKLVVLRWAYADDEPVVFLLAAQRTSNGNDMLILNIEVFLNRLVYSDVELLRDLQEEIWPNMLRHIHNSMEWSDLNLEEQLANMP